ncbi:uncharacterized protein At1g66480-like [Solanum pennellii]|uniref:Uncharacterized protein At1g66480-like n=1 Tax=Solanum pennellii TaxID=28526 RepID=A0ABM1GTC0_SOLPN|nr:uncharacterized protein At1g66480-like [Solanum pennellii]
MKLNMGNIILGRKKSTKVMKIDGQTMKFKTPVYANEVLKNYPSMVLLESEEVKHFGVRAKPLEPQQELKPKRLYFLVELPKLPEENKKSPFRARSAIQMSAKERLETLMLARRSVSDLSIMKPTSMTMSTHEYSSSHTNNSTLDILNSGGPAQGHPTRLKLRLSKAEVEKLMMESKDENEVAQKIMKLCMNNNNGGNEPLMEQSHNNEGIVKKGVKAREKRVGFLPITEGEIQLAEAAS